MKRKTDGMMPKHRTESDASLDGRPEQPVGSMAAPAEASAVALDAEQAEPGNPSAREFPGGDDAAAERAEPAVATAVAAQEEAAEAEAIPAELQEEPAAEEPPAGEVPVVRAQGEAAPDKPPAGEAPARDAEVEQPAEGEAIPAGEEVPPGGEPPAGDAPVAGVEAEGRAQEEPLAVVAAAATAEEEAAPGEPLPDTAEAAEPAPGELLAAVAAAAVAQEVAVAEPPPGQAPAVVIEAAEPAGGDSLPAGEGGPAATVVALVAAEGEGAATGRGLEPEHAAALALERKKRRRLLIALGALVVLLIAMAAIFGRYLWRPGPLPELLPLPVDVNYRPHYLFSIYGVELPAGVAASPDGERIYVAETGGQRQIKILDRDGNLLGSLAPPHTEPAERAPVYVAVDPADRVFVTDRLQRAVFVYGPDGKMLDAILGPDLTLSEYLSEQVDGLGPGGVVAYNGLAGSVLYRKAGQGEQALPAPDPAGWAPLGVRLDAQGTMLLTNVAEGQHLVRAFPGKLILAANWQEFDPPEFTFGTQGQGQAEFLFPNSAVADSQGRIYVTDGNNGRISVWDELGTFLFTFGRGVGEGALSLPRGAAMDGQDRLHIVDAVQQAVKVYDVSGPEPRFLYAFGDWGTGDGQFNFPGDIALDSTGRLYIADRKNNRIQVWSY